MCKLDCPSGKRKEKAHKITGLHSSEQPKKHTSKGNPPELGRRRDRINDVVTCLAASSDLTVTHVLLNAEYKSNEVS